MSTTAQQLATSVIITHLPTHEGVVRTGIDTKINDQWNTAHWKMTLEYDIHIGVQHVYWSMTHTRTHTHTSPLLSTSACTSAGTMPNCTRAEPDSSSLAVTKAKIQAASTRRGSSLGAPTAVPCNAAITSCPTCRKGFAGVLSPRARFEIAHAAVRAISTDWIAFNMKKKYMQKEKEEKNRVYQSTIYIATILSLPQVLLNLFLSICFTTRLLFQRVMP